MIRRYGIKRDMHCFASLWNESLCDITLELFSRVWTIIM